MIGGLNINFSTYEEELEYLVDKVDNPLNNKTWVDMVDDLGTNTHPDVLRKSFTGGRYGGYAVYKYFINKIAEGCSTEEQERLEILRNEVYKERCKNADILREKRKILRDEARFETLTDVLKEETKNLKPIKLNDFKSSTKSERVYGIAQFSDWHYGKLIDNQWNYYDLDVAVERANTIVDKVIDKSEKHGVTNLIIEINGDMLDGIINISSRNVEEADIITQIVGISELLAQVINKLIPYYENVKVVTTLGNHGRVWSDKRNCATAENFEMLIPEFLRLRLDKRVIIITSHGLDFASYEINGDLICVAHGQNDKLATVISDFTNVYKKLPKEIHLGHTHSYKDINDCDVFVTVNGNLCGSDDYAVSLRKITKPSQNFIVYDGSDRCIYSLIAD